MRSNPAWSVRTAWEDLQACCPESCHQHTARIAPDEVAADFARRYAGIPATALARSEDAVVYTRVEGADFPVLLGLYGDRERVRQWLPGLPRRANRAGIARLTKNIRSTREVMGASCQAHVHTEVDLTRLPNLQATPRDAGPYLTMGVVCAYDPHSRTSALSVHRMLVLGQRELTIWMLPSRQLRALYQAAAERGEHLPVTINVGAPPAAVVASALTTAVLPRGVSKLGLAGALAGRPLTLARAHSQPALALADSELVLEGYLDGRLADECLDDTGPGVSLPEFLGHDGTAHAALPVVTVTAVTSRPQALYQAVIGPGREQSVILGMAGALSVAMGASRLAAELITDLYFPAAGGGMLLLIVQVRKTAPPHDEALATIASEIFGRHSLIKTIIFVDDDINVASEEDVFWAITTRANLGADCVSIAGFPALPMDPSQRPAWLNARSEGKAGRTYIDATAPYGLKATVARSFPSLLEA